MKIAFLLHFYQPHNQQEDILNRIVNECYIPLTEGLLKIPRAKIILNMNGALTELLDNKGYAKVLENINELSNRGQIEFTGSAKYPAFLPLLPKDEIKRQIEQNNITNKKYFPKYDPVGFFSPEMAINDKVIEVAKEMGFEWIGADQVAYSSGECLNDKLYKDQKTGMKVFFRSKRVSILMLSAISRNAEDLIKETRDLHEQSEYYFGVMDAETFGHHRIGHEKMLFDVLSHEFFEPLTAKDLIEFAKENMETEELEIRPSTWTNQEQDFWLDKEKKQSTTAKSFILWQDPENPIHKLQWELLNYAIELVNTYPEKHTPKYEEARSILDKAVASDQFWWASTKPWWSLEMIEQGAYETKSVVTALGIDESSIKKAEDLYRRILDQAFYWQRSGFIRKRNVENSGTYMQPALKDRTSDEWFNQLVLEFEHDMNESIKKLDFEKAIKWRDAIIKIGLGTDKYDILHVLDELWLGRNAPWAQPQVKPFLEHTWEEFSSFAKEHFRSVKNEQDFKAWKAKKESEQTSN